MRVLIADDHPLFRDGLRSLLEARGIDVVGEARNGREAVDQAGDCSPRSCSWTWTCPSSTGSQRRD